MPRRWVALLLASVVALAACGPEAVRGRAGGPGADTGNRGAAFDAHGSRNPFSHTPLVGQAIRK